MGKDTEVTVGYRYYLGLHLAISYPVDELQEIWCGDRLAWSGHAASGRITVSAENLYGGERREGGVSGAIDVLDGGQAQPKNDYLQAKIGGVIPAFRGVFSLVFRHFYVGNNPYIKKMAFKVKRTDVQTDGTPQWYPAKAAINGGDLNPAHIVRECLVNQDWGLGYDVTVIDDNAFTAAAIALFDEGFGLSVLWNQQEEIEAFVQRVLDHIDAVLREDPHTGLIGLHLIRGDYDPATIPLLDESNVLRLESFERRAWGDTVNEITVIYTDRDSGNEGTVTVQDIGNIQIQGAVVNQTRQYPGIPNGALALRAAMRDLRALGTPLSGVTIVTNRHAWALRRGDVFRFSWPKLGIVEVVYRIVDIDDGDLIDGEITLTAVEDVFGFPASVYASPQPSVWVPPNNDPAPVPHQRAIEAGYWDVERNVKPADIAQFGPDFGFALTLGVRPSGDAYNYLVMSRSGTAPFEERTVAPFCPTAELDGALAQYTGAQTDVVVPIRNPIDIDGVETGTYAYIDDEAVAIKAVGETSITVDRGVLDTVPAAHADGARIWFAERNHGFDETELVDGQVVDLKLLPSTGLGTLPEADATSMSLTLDLRYQRPYPPGRFQVVGQYYPADMTGQLSVTWAHRDRSLQLAYLNHQEEGDIGPEPGVTYKVQVYNDDTGALLASQDAIQVTSWTDDTSATAVARFLRVELSAWRDGLRSRQIHQHVVERLDYALSTHRQLVTIPATNVPSTLTDHVVLITEANLDPGIFANARADGMDIIATDLAGTRLSREITVFDPTAGKLRLWVRMPTLDAATDTQVYLYYGSGIATPNDPATWAARYEAVVHLDNPDYRDSSQNARAVTVVDAGEIPMLFEQTAISPDVDCHQGVATDGTDWFTIDTNRIDRRASDWSLISQNTDPAGDIGGIVNHIGDGDCYNGKLYVPAEKWVSCSDFGGQVIALFDTATLALAETHDISANGHEVSSLVVEPDHGVITVTSYCDPDHLYQYDLATFMLVKTITLSAGISTMQGITRIGNYYYINSGTPDTTYKVRRDGTVLGRVYRDQTATYEGITTDGTNLYLLIDNGVGDKRVRTLTPTNGTLFKGEDPAVAETGTYLRLPVSTGLATCAMEVFFSPADNIQRAICTYVNVAAPQADDEFLTLAIDNGNDYGAWDKINGWLASGIAPTLGQLHHGVVTFDENASRGLYLDGSQVAAETTTGAFPAGRNELWIGCDDAGTNYLWNGTIKEARLLNVIPSADEVAVTWANHNDPATFYSAGAEEAGSWSV